MLVLKPCSDQLDSNGSAARVKRTISNILSDMLSGGLVFSD